MLVNKKYNEFHENSSIQKKPIKKNNFTYRLVIKEIEKILTDIKRNGIKILDYGCGVGTLAFYLASIGKHVTGVDISPLSVDLCNKSARKMGMIGKVRFSVSSNFWRRLTNVHVKYDLIICSEVIEHINNDVQLMGKLSGILNKGGYIFLTTPSKNAPLFRMKVTKSFDSKVGHLRRYDVEALKAMFRNAGMKVEKVCRVEGMLRNSLFVIPQLTVFIKFLKGPLSDIVTAIDSLMVPITGESNIFIIAQKI